MAMTAGRGLSLHCRREPHRLKEPAAAGLIDPESITVDRCTSVTFPAVLSTTTIFPEDGETRRVLNRFRKEQIMRSQIVLALLAALLLVAAVQAKEPKRYHSGQLLQMDSVQCGIDEKDG